MVYFLLAPSTRKTSHVEQRDKSPATIGYIMVSAKNSTGTPTIAITMALSILTFITALLLKTRGNNTAVNYSSITPPYLRCLE